jgi:hypothetical protein
MTSNSEWVMITIISVAWLSFTFWTNWSARKKAEKLGKLQEYKEKKGRLNAVVYILIGSLILGLMWFSWSAVLAGNFGPTYFSVALGLALILYGVFRFYRLKR